MNVARKIHVVVHKKRALACRLGVTKECQTCETSFLTLLSAEEPGQSSTKKARMTPMLAKRKIVNSIPVNWLAMNVPRNLSA